MALSGIAKDFEYHDQLKVKPFLTASEKVDFEHLLNKFDGLGVNPFWLDLSAIKARHSLTLDPTLKESIYNNLADDSVFKHPPPQLVSGTAFERMYETYVVSPKIFFKKYFKQPVIKTAATSAYGAILVTNPITALQIASAMPFYLAASKIGKSVGDLQQALAPYIQPGKVLESKLQEKQRRILFAPFSAPIKAIVEEAGLGRPQLKFGPSWRIRTAMANKFSRGASVPWQKTSKRLRYSKKSVLTALTFYLLGDLILEGIKKWLGDKAEELLTKAGRSLRFLKRGRSLFSVNAAGGGLLGAGIGAAIGLPLPGAIAGWAAGGTYDLYHKLATEAGGEKFWLEYNKLNRGIKSIEYFQSIGHPGYQSARWNWQLRAYRLRRFLYGPSKFMAEHRLARLPIKGGLLGFGLQQAGIVSAPQALGITAAWYGWNDLRPWLQLRGAETLARGLYGPKIVADLGLGNPATGYGLSPSKVTWAQFNQWMRLKHSNWVRFFRSAKAGGIAGVAAGGTAAFLGVPAGTAALIGLGTAAGVTAASFGGRLAIAAAIPKFESLFARVGGSTGFISKIASWGPFGKLATGTGTTLRIGRFAFRFGGKAIPAAGWAYTGVEALHGAETGQVFGFKSLSIPGTNINISFGGATGKVANFGIATGSGAMTGATIGGIVGGSVSLGILALPGAAVGALVGAAVGATSFAVNELLLKLTGKGLVTWTKIAIQKGIIQAPNSVKIGMVLGAPAGPAGIAIGGGIGWAIHATGLDGLFASAYNAIAPNWFKDALSGTGNLIKDGWGWFRNNVLRIGEDVVAKGVDWVTAIAAQAINILVAFATAIMTLMSGGDIYQAAVSLAIALILLFAVIAGGQADQAAADAFLNLTKTANPTHIENNQLPAPVEFKIKLEAKDKPLTNITYQDNITGGGVTTPRFINNFPTQLAANEIFEHTLLYTAPNQPQFNDSVISNKITVKFDVSAGTTDCATDFSFAVSQNELPAIYCAASAYFGVPAGVIAGISNIEGYHVFEHTDAQIAQYSAPSAKDPDRSGGNESWRIAAENFTGCVVSINGAVGPMQFLYPPVFPYVPDPGGFDTWGENKDAVNQATSENRSPEVCNVKDSIFAAAAKNRRDCGENSHCPRTGDWDLIGVNTAASSYYGSCSSAVIGPLTYCESVWNFYQSHKR